MRWVAWVVVVSACAKPGGGAPAPAPAPSVMAAVSAPSASSHPPAPAPPASAAPVDTLPTLPSASPEVVLGGPARDSKSKLCQVVVDGFTMLRPCTGAAGEKEQSTVALSGKGGSCLVTVGDIQIVRPCEGKPGERRAIAGKATAPRPKLCQRIEHTVEGDIVTLRPCAK